MKVLLCLRLGARTAIEQLVSSQPELPWNVDILGKRAQTDVTGDRFDRTSNLSTAKRTAEGKAAMLEGSIWTEQKQRPTNANLGGKSVNSSERTSQKSIQTSRSQTRFRVNYAFVLPNPSHRGST